MHSKYYYPLFTSLVHVILTFYLHILPSTVFQDWPQEILSVYMGTSFMYALASLICHIATFKLNTVLGFYCGWQEKNSSNHDAHIYSKWKWKWNEIGAVLGSFYGQQWGQIYCELNWSSNRVQNVNFVSRSFLAIQQRMRNAVEEVVGWSLTLLPMTAWITFSFRKL